MVFPRRRRLNSSSTSDGPTTSSSSTRTDSSTSTTSSTSSISSTRSKLTRFNVMVRRCIAKQWNYFRNDKRIKHNSGRSFSIAGLYNIEIEEGHVVRSSLEEYALGSLCVPPGIAPSPSSPQLCKLDTATVLPLAHFTPAATAILVEAPASDSEAGSSDAEAGRRVRPALTSSKRKSGEGATAGGGGMAGGAPRSAPSTPLQLDSLPPAGARLATHAAGKQEKSGIKQLSSSAPSVHATPAKTPRTPSKARQKKFLRHFPQVSPDERVLNYYACALVGDILLQGHLYITKNYFAFYSNVFGYVTKLLIPTSSVLRVSKEKMARIIPNAVGVATDDERHVFGSLLSRDSTYKLMTQVWKAAVTADELVVETPAKELRGSEIELDASEYSPEEESSCSGSGTEAPTTARRRTPAPRTRPDGEPLPISVTKPPPVIQPALLLSNTTTSAAASAASKRNEGSGAPVFATAAIFAVLLALSAALMVYRLQAVREAGHVRYYKEHFHERQDENVLLWQSQLHGQAAGELQQFLNTNLHLLSKVRQSLEALSTLILTDATRQNQLDGAEERRTDADERGAES